METLKTLVVVFALVALSNSATPSLQDATTVSYDDMTTIGATVPNIPGNMTTNNPTTANFLAGLLNSFGNTNSSLLNALGNIVSGIVSNINNNGSNTDTTTNAPGNTMGTAASNKPNTNGGGSSGLTDLITGLLGGGNGLSSVLLSLYGVQSKLSNGRADEVYEDVNNVFVQAGVSAECSEDIIFFMNGLLSGQDWATTGKKYKY